MTRDSLIITTLISVMKKRGFRNSDLAPGSAETWVFPSLGKVLLIDPATGALRPDDEARFVGWMADIWKPKENVTEEETNENPRKKAFRLVNAFNHDTTKKG
jgi:glycine cleavage system protein P-like pyridoxal-binding family